MKFLLFLLSFLVLSAPVFATPFCEELRNPAAYKKHDLDNYALMIGGHDGYIFRSGKLHKTGYILKKDNQDIFKIFAHALKDVGTQIILVYPPHRPLVHADKIKAKDIKSFDFTAEKQRLYRKNYNQSLEDLNAGPFIAVGYDPSVSDTQLYYKTDHHWHPHLSRKIADKVADIIKNHEFYKEIALKTLVLKVQKAKTITGVYKTSFKKICGTALEGELIPRYQAVSDQADPVSEQDLFEDKQEDIVLIGTSNSALPKDLANFQPFLEVALQARIVNYAENGDGILNPLKNYLQSESFQNHPPEFLIWEVPGYYNLNYTARKIKEDIMPLLK